MVISLHYHVLYILFIQKDDGTDGHTDDNDGTDDGTDGQKTDDDDGMLIASC